MNKFTKKEISLCRQVAEKHRKDIEKSDMYFYQDEIHLWSMPFKQTKDIVTTDEIIPLWTISDCLEFLRERCQDHVLLIHDEGDEKEWWLWMDEYTETQQVGSGKTPLEACLKAVLAVLEEGKSEQNKGMK
jgi:hypothetical protein